MKLLTPQLAMILQRDASSPWWIADIAKVIGCGRPPGVYMPPFECWLLWRYAFEIKGEGFQAAPAGTTLGLQEAA